MYTFPSNELNEFIKEKGIVKLNLLRIGHNNIPIHYEGYAIYEKKTKGDINIVFKCNDGRKIKLQPNDQLIPYSEIYPRLGIKDNDATVLERLRKGFSDI